MNDMLHALTNSLHQIVGYAGLLRRHPDRIEEYLQLIEKSAYGADALLQDLVHGHHPSPERSRRSMGHGFAPVPLQGKKVMIIDDMDENREILRDLFLTLRCDVACAASGAEALEKYPLVAPDVVCMDIVMPGKDGFETAWEMREGGCRAAFIAISALKHSDERGLFDAWLSKPFTAEEILGVLGSLDPSPPKSPFAPPDFSPLSPEFRGRLAGALDKGALSQAERLVASLPPGACRAWLEKKLSELDFEAIRATIFSA